MIIPLNKLYIPQGGNHEHRIKIKYLSYQTT
jgi:hypothetical protein